MKSKAMIASCTIAVSGLLATAHPQADPRRELDKEREWQRERIFEKKIKRQPPLRGAIIMPKKNTNAPVKTNTPAPARNRGR